VDSTREGADGENWSLKSLGRGLLHLEKTKLCVRGSAGNAKVLEKKGIILVSRKRSGAVEKVRARCPETGPKA